MAILLKPRSNKQGLVDATADLAITNGRDNYTVLVKDIGIFEWVPVGPADGSNIFAGANGFWSKVNDGTVPVSSEPYLVYSALVSFNGSTFTIATLRNTLGQTITWTNPSNGLFRATSTGTPFTVGKTWIQSASYIGNAVTYTVYGSRVSNTQIRIQGRQNSDNAVGAAFGFPVFFEIRVYP